MPTGVFCRCLCLITCFSLIPSASDARLSAQRTGTAEEQRHRLAIAANPEDADAHFKLSVLLDTVHQDSAGEEEHLRLALAANPKHVGAHYNLACVLRDVHKDRTGEEKHLRLALAANPEHANAHFSLSNILRDVHKNRPGEEEHLRLAIAANPKHAGAHFNLSYIFRDVRRDRAGEEEHLRLAIAADPKHAHAHFNLSYIFRDVRKDWAGAEEHLRLAIAADPKHADAHFNLAYIFLYVRKDWASAEEHLRLAIPANPKHANAHFSLSNVLREVRKDWAGEEEHLRLAIAANPKHADAHFHLSYIFHHVHKDRAGEEKHLRLAIAANPQHASAHLNLNSLLTRKSPLGKLDLEESYPEGLVDASPHRDGRHLRLGISRNGLFSFLGEMKFCLHRAGVDASRASLTKAVNDLGAWQYDKSVEKRAQFCRDQWFEWLDGPVEEGGSGGKIRGGGLFGLRNMTGYDLKNLIYEWLDGNRCKDYSVCEAILLKPELQDLRKHVGEAKVFWSHMQQEPFLGERLSELGDAGPVLKSDKAASTAGLMREVFHCQGTSSPFVTGKQAAQKLFLSRGEKKKKFFSREKRADRGADDFRNDTANAVPIWLDYTSLRQCVDDFNMPFVQQLIWSVPVFVAAAESCAYTSRTFCVFELFNSYWARNGRHEVQELWVVQNFGPNVERMRAECEKIKTAEATTRSPLHKDLIDAYIMHNVTGGFAGLDEMIVNVFKESVEHLGAEACGAEGEGDNDPRTPEETNSVCRPPDGAANPGVCQAEAIGSGAQGVRADESGKARHRCVVQ